ncbi:hypothetical protein T265_06606 [Opisthorchis viverrini]|uniref:Protein kinase domain-containing protein n=1 Tax=Opisthorchis viverrini TaxID=6198 RepID=A0A074ZFL9_OPIVI|nr:hypothetical protein T265_06606 [Opisthorchis viverrini]KER26076.1 hypothetical protein T265_06606 [Opisthorchis viverrini]
MLSVLPNLSTDIKFSCCFSAQQKNNAALTEPNTESPSQFTEYWNNFTGTLLVEGNFSNSYTEPGRLKDHHSVNGSTVKASSFGLVFGIGVFILLLVGLLGVLILKCKSKLPANLRWYLCLNRSNVPETSIRADANRKQRRDFWSKHLHIIPEEAVQVFKKVGEITSTLPKVLGQYEDEDLSNRPLKDLYQHNTLLAPSQVFAMLVDISIGLEYLHDHGYAYGVSSPSMLMRFRNSYT